MCSRIVHYPRNMGMPHFNKVFGLGDIPNDWDLPEFVGGTGPVFLCCCFGRANHRQPDFHREMEAWSSWYKIPPKAHHVVYQEAGRVRSVAFDHSQAISTFHVQRFESGWLLGESRGTGASVIP